MNNFSKDRRPSFGGGGNRFGGGGGGGFNKRGNFGGGGRGQGPSVMHQAVCDDCDRNCEVPFKPTGNRPVLCSNCFQGSKGGSSAPSRDFGDRGRDRDSGRSAMHHATCSDCGKGCEVPFKPMGNKPIFCSDCFQNQKGGGFKERPAQKNNFEDRKMHVAICDGCESKFELPFRPTGSKPVYCNSCFGREAGVKEDKADAIKQQFDALNGKLDKLIKLLLPVVSTESAKALMEIKEDKGASKKKAEQDFEEIEEGPLVPKKEKAKVVVKKAEPAKKKAEKKTPAKKEVAKKATAKKEVAKKKPAVKVKAKKK